MRFKEISNEADNLRYVKLIFQRTLFALNDQFKKNVKKRKNEKRTAKQRAKTRRLLKHRKGSNLIIKKPDRPKR